MTMVVLRPSNTRVLDIYVVSGVRSIWLHCSFYGF